MQRCPLELELMGEANRQIIKRKVNLAGHVADGGIYIYIYSVYIYIFVYLSIYVFIYVIHVVS